jgi:hypothetical protein
MKLDEIKQVVDELDKNIPKDKAKVSFQKYGGDLDEAFIVATERGYLRLGVEFLKAGLAPYVPGERSLGKRPYAIDVEIDYLITEDSDVHFDYFERSEDLTVKTYRETWVDKVIPLAILGVIISILALAVVGIGTIFKAVF